ncbi:MAG TPA: dUTP diphosphatase [Beijerinckiaceae bacterium]
MSLTVSLRRLPHGAGLPLPAAATPGAAGLDLHAAVPAETQFVLAPMRRALVPTGFCLHLPQGFEAQVRPRSGLAWRHGITVLNAPGTVDADYRGEVMVLLVHLGSEAFSIARGDRIAQLVIAPILSVSLVETDEVEGSARGTGGFGSTGL